MSKTAKGKTVDWELLKASANAAKSGPEIKKFEPPVPEKAAKKVSGFKPEPAVETAEKVQPVVTTKKVVKRQMPSAPSVKPQVSPNSPTVVTAPSAPSVQKIEEADDKLPSAPSED